jgi:hypothetical protein
MMIWYVIAAVVIGFAYKSRVTIRAKLLKQFPEIFLKREVALDDYELAALKSFKSQTRSFVLTIVISVGIAFWLGTYQPLQVKKDLELQSRAYAESIPEGWQFQCKDIFSNFIGDGIYLFAGGNRYDSTWCTSLLSPSRLEQLATDENLFTPSEYSDVEGAKSDGFNIGARFALDSVFSRVPYLCYGTECITKNSIIDWYIEQNRYTSIP